MPPKKINFNPAFFVLEKKDSSGMKRILELPAQLMWMNAERPGWRLTSDGCSIQGMEDFDESAQEKFTRYVVTGHVAVVDEQGRRVISVPSSAEVNSPNFAQIFFEKGASFALTLLGYNVYSISNDQWREVEEFKNRAREPLGAERVFNEEKSGGILSKVKDMFTQQKDENDYIPPSNANMFENNEPQEYEKPGQSESEDDSYEEDKNLVQALSVFKKAAKKKPELVRDGREINDDNIRPIFEKFCFSIIGTPWDLADDNEKAEVMRALHKMS